MKNRLVVAIYMSLAIGAFLLFSSSCKKGDNNNDSSINTEFADSRDGNLYKAVTIGSQVWMAENLAYEPSVGNYWTIDNNLDTVDVYGCYYDWHTAINVCPDGWHLPSQDEWDKLFIYLGINHAGKLKAVGTKESETGLWHEPNIGATNETGFTAVPGGFRKIDGTFYGVGYNANLWSATEGIVDNAWEIFLHHGNGMASMGNVSKVFGRSVRCVKD